jgi:hypothetical protein
MRLQQTNKENHQPREETTYRIEGNILQTIYLKGVNIENI